jgi:uncharacterized membrane protein
MDNARHTPRPLQIAGAAALGALLMYLLDPQQGRRRIALARDQATRLMRHGREMADAGLRDLGHRADGLVAQLRGALRGMQPDDVVLVERVRAQLGRVVSHPHAVEVAAAAGAVTLSGPILKSEERALLDAVRAVHGVRELHHRLDVHQSAAHVPSLQGGRTRTQPRMEFLQQNWAPGPRLAAFGLGTALLAFGRGRGVPGALLGLAGLGLIARSASNKRLSRLLGVRGGRRAVDLQKAIHISAPRERVFALWSEYDNFPRFMSLVEQVRPLDDTRSHWVVKGPAGTRLEWDSVLTERVEPALLAWRSEAGAPVQHAGVVRFDGDGDGTRVTVRMSYNPPGGALGHTIASLLGRDPLQAMDADLMRMKAFVETGVAPHDAASPGDVKRKPGPARGAAGR